MKNLTNEEIPKEAIQALKIIEGCGNDLANEGSLWKTKQIKAHLQ